MFEEPGSARQEAERLVAALLAAATMAANANPRLSTGSAECCICPLCRVIAAIRDPDPAVVERLATGAGDLAEGVASFLRNVASPSSESADPWHRATTAAGSAADGAAAGGTAYGSAAGAHGDTDAGKPPATKVMAKKAVAKKIAKKVAETVVTEKAGERPHTTDDAGKDASGPQKKVAKKAVPPKAPREKG